MSRIDACLLTKIEKNIDKIGTDLREYKACKDGNYLHNRETAIKLSHIFNWTQSFLVGISLWAYVDTNNEKYLDWAEQFKNQYREKVFETPGETMHDLGFLYSTYAVMLYNITGDEEYKKIGVKAATELAMRFIPNGRYIRAWGRMDGKIPDYVDPELAKNRFFADSEGLAIIDCMMNLPLLFWASKVTKKPFYARVAIMHADMTSEYFVREDFSVRHAYRFSEKLGIPLYEDNDCGYSVGSHWARGTSWAIYGYAIAYKYTQIDKYKDISMKLLEKFAEESKWGIPVWDFRLPADSEKSIDTSAAAIVLCAILELENSAGVKKFESYKEVLRKKLKTYVNYDENVMGILREQNGNHKYALYGDYFYIESLMKENSSIDVW